MSEEANKTVHVFGIRPGTCGEDEGYALPHWEPEPPEEASDEEYDQWQERNPVWGLRTDLGCYLDEDFVEYFDDSDRDMMAYVESQLANPGDIEAIRAALPEVREIVLVFSEALDGSPATMKSTSGADYAGEFACKD